MTGLILCTGEPAKTPYYILGLGMNIYSSEELCFYLCENSYILDRDIMDVKLCRWIERELGLRRLGAQLGEMLENEKELSEFVTTILREIHYCTEEEIEAIRVILEENASLGFAQKRKARGDSLLQTNKLSLAIDEYHYILQGMKPEEDPQLYSSILHNAATAYSRLFLFEKAGEYYRQAYDTDHNEESYRQYLATMRIVKEQAAYMNTLVLKGIDQDIAEHLENTMNEVMAQKPDTEYAKDLEKIMQLKTAGKVNEFYDTIEQVLSAWKSDYRKGMMNI